MNDMSEIRPRMVDGDAMCVPESCIYWQDAFRTCTITYCQTNECWPYYRAALAESQEEMGEQCRLLGMGAEREAILLSRVESLEAALNEGAPCAICSHVERASCLFSTLESVREWVKDHTTPTASHPDGTCICMNQNPVPAIKKLRALLAREEEKEKKS